MLPVDGLQQSGTIQFMPTRSSKLDLNQLAKSIVDQATGESPAEEAVQKPARGSAGGKARSKNLTDEERIDAARLAANVRWKRGN